jgi:hypothetical protein
MKEDLEEGELMKVMISLFVSAVTAGTWKIGVHM